MPLDCHALRVLVVDDEPAVLRMVATMLEHAGFTVQTAHSGADALALIREQPEAVHLLLSDIMMPGLGGLELASKAGEIAPLLPILFMSGFTGMAAPHGPLIAKPFKSAELIAAIERVLSPSRRAPGRQGPSEAVPGAAQSA
ncbi:MAG TPA: response regulator [Bryobacteraceae bacterium]|nr:response regulator [Bryobacteraceae bacterium]